MTYPEAIEFLYDLRWLGIKLGLDHTRRLAARFGNPQDRLRFIHVAGTNGKGSTCALLESIYRAAGFRVGLFTSPHLVSFRERIQIDRQWISEPDVAQRVTRFRELLATFPPDHMPTFFEVVAVLALDYFAAAGCDVVLWETGMGGRLDATNIVMPLCSVITTISFDHQQWLGDTLARIAAEKAGIIKPGVPVVTGAAEPEALEVIRQVARHYRAPLTEVSAADAHHPPLDTVAMPLRGEHQRLNAATARAVVGHLQAAFPVSPATFVAGLRSAQLAGRFQLLEDRDGRITLLDGAHNPAGAHALRVALETERFAARRPVMIFGVLQEKDWPAMCAELLPLAGRVLLTPVASTRSANPSELLPVCHRLNPHVEAGLAGSLREALDRTAGEPLRLITGSLYLVGEALELLQPGGTLASERHLNEKGAVNLPARASPSCW